MIREKLSRRSILKTLAALPAALFARSLPAAEVDEQSPYRFDAIPPKGGSFTLASTQPLHCWSVLWGDLTLRYIYDEPLSEIHFRILPSGQPYPEERPDSMEAILPPASDSVAVEYIKTAKPIS